MSPGADVRAIDALRGWLASLRTYRSDAAEALSGIRIEIARGQAWVVEQLELWQRSIRKFDDAVVQARSALAAKKFPDFNGRMPDTTREERDLKRALAALEHANDQVAKCRRWSQQLPKMVDEVFNGPAQRLSNFLEADVPVGAADLDRRIESLERYAGLRTDFTGGSVASSEGTP